jgi:uncharacterized membrane protein
MMRGSHKVGPPPGGGPLLAVPLLSLMLAWSQPALAYVGPGAGITMLGALWAVIAAILLALGGLIWWPLRTIRRRRKQAANAAATAAADQAHGD